MRHRTKRVVKWIAGSLILTAVVWGLIIYGPGIWGWIQERASGGTTSIKEITQNPYAYENQQVVVIARVTAMFSFGSAIDDEGFFMPLSNIPPNFMAFGDKYKIRGEVINVVRMIDSYVMENHWAIEISDINKV